MRAKLIKGILLIVVPLIAIGAGFYYFSYFTPKVSGGIASLNKGFGITFDHPPPNFFDRNSQLMIGFGLCIASICWGIAKVISAVRGK